MTSSGPYTQSYDFTWQCEKPDCIVNIYDFTNIENYKTIRKLICSSQENYTMFITKTDTIENDNLIETLKASTVRGIIPKEVLTDSPFQIIQTLSKSNPLYVEVDEDGDVLLNGKHILLESNIKVDNGIIHIIDSPIKPLKYSI